MEADLNKNKLDQNKEWRFWKLKHPDYLHPHLPHISTEKFVSIWDLPTFILSIIPFLFGLYILLTLQIIPKILGKNKISSEELRCLLYASFIRRYGLDRDSFHKISRGS